MTETCADDGPNVITDVATMPATSADTAAVAGIHARLEHRGLLRCVNDLGQFLGLIMQRLLRSGSW